MRYLTFFIVIIITLFFSSSATAQITDRIFLRITPPTGMARGCYITFAASYSEAYKQNEDGISQTVGNTVGTVIEDGTNTILYIQGLPMKDNRTMRVAFSTAMTGNYRFDWDVANPQIDLKSAILIDTETNTEIDLLATPKYEFNVTSVVYSNTTRFKLLINHINISDISMLVSGNMRISGPIRSDGVVHVFASSVNTGKIDIDNETNSMLMTDMITLYSTDSSDGLLRNRSDKGVKGVSVSNPYKVSLHKSFTKDKHAAISLPFDVKKENILGPDGKALIAYNPSKSETENANAQYGVWEMDIQRRADESSVSSDLWKDINYDGGLKKAKGYMFQSDDDRAIDFVTTNSDEIKRLFSNKDKSINFDVYATNILYENPEYGDGWNQIGGLNSTSFRLEQNTISDYTGTAVWIRKKNTSQAVGTSTAGGFQEYYVGSGTSSLDKVLDLSPYAPFFVLIEPSGKGLKANEGKFTFKENGLILESPLYRSAQEESGPATDKLFFRLTSNKDNSFDRFYLLFSNDYSESFRASEDAVKMSTTCEDSPAFWCLQDVTNKQLFVNGLPMKDGREVKVGLSLPEKSEYTISIDAMLKENVRNVILVDNFAKKEVDLLQTPYSFSSDVIKNESGRFSVFINRSYTSIPSLEYGSAYAYVNDNILTVKNLSEGDQVKVFDLSGRLVVSGKVSGKEFSAALNQKGVYVVNATGENTTVLKVLNK